MTNVTKENIQTIAKNFEDWYGEVEEKEIYFQGVFNTLETFGILTPSEAQEMFCDIF